MTLYKIWTSTKAHPRGLCAARLELSPSPSTARVATWERRFGAHDACRLGFVGPRYTADTCTGFRQYFQGSFFIPHRVHSLSDFGLSTNF